VIDSVALVRPEHLALAANRQLALLTIIVLNHSVLNALLIEVGVLDEVFQKHRQFTDETTALCNRSVFEAFAAVRTLHLVLHAAADASVAVKLRAERTHCGIPDFLIADVTVNQFLELFLLDRCGTFLTATCSPMGTSVGCSDSRGCRHSCITA